ncbi:MAG: type II secretion system F family protein [Campylobacterota bacterium]
MIFAYKGINAEGKKVSNKIEATSLEEAKSKLKAQGVIYKSIEEESPSVFSGINLSRRYRISPNELSQLSRELAMYIRSGISIVGALKIIQNQYMHKKKLYLFLKTVSTYLDEGKNFYASLDEQKIVILPEFYTQSIRVSESSGILDEVLLELSRFLKEQDRISKEIKSAFAYPAFMILISLFMVGFMLAFVVPQITGIFEGMGQELPAATRFVITLGDFFNNNFMTIGVLIVLLVGAHSFMMHYSASYKYGAHSLMLKMPLFGTVALKSELGRFTYVGSLLVRSGVPFVQTINLSANILNNSVLKSVFLEASKKVVEGKRLSIALNESSYKLDPSFLQAIAVGEETSQIEPVLSNISELYFEDNRDKIGIILSLLEPMLMLFVGGTIGFIVAAMLLPIFSMSIT